MSEERLRKDINRLKQLTNGCIPEFHQDIEDVLDRFEQLKEMFEDSKTYSKQFLYKHNKNLLEANERLSRKNEQLKSSIGSLEIALKERTEERDKHSFKEHLCKKVIEKANDELITLIQIIMEQPSKNVEKDNYLLSRLESISNILVGGNNE